MMCSRRVIYLPTVFLVLLWSHSQGTEENAFSKIAKVNLQYGKWIVLLATSVVFNLIGPILV